MKRRTKLADKLDKAIDIDNEGNIEAGKDLKIDGKLKRAELISDNNPDGTFDPSASGGGEAFDIIYLNDNDKITSGSFTGEKPVILNQNNGYFLYSQSFANIDGTRTLIITEAQGIKYNVKVYSNDNLITSADGSYLYSHFITLTSSSLGSVNFNFYNTSEDALTIATLKTALSGKSASCSGFIKDGGSTMVACGISGAGGGLSVDWFDASDASTGTTTIDNTFSISDLVSAVE